MKSLSKTAVLAVVVLLAAGLVFAGGKKEPGTTTTTTTTTAAAQPSKYNESPMLAKLVQEGKLPPVAERLPDEPLVVKVEESIGQYGGTWRRWNDHPRIFAWEPLIKVDIDGSLHPNLATSVDISPDMKTFTFHLRKGVKWSDGVPFTSEDIMFMWNDLATHKDYPTIKLGSDGMNITAPDAWTVVVSYPAPRPGFMAYQSTQWGGLGFVFASYPKHYLKQFHPNYLSADEMAKVLKDSGMDTWQQLFDARYYVEGNPEVPVLTPWRVTTKSSEAVQMAERNHYYWKVDAQGNQLPYIDYATWPSKADHELGLLRVAAGEIDMTTEGFNAADTPVLFDNAAKGNYTVYKVNFDFQPSMTTLYINQNYVTDPEMGEVLRNLNFRKALSVAINRAEINEFIALGQGKPAQATVPATHFAGSKELASYMIQYDPALAAQLLDQAGLSKKDAEGFRLLPSGKKMTLVIAPRSEPDLKAAEVLRKHFEDVGVRVSISTEDLSFWMQNKNNGLHMISQYSLGNGTPELRDTWWIPINANAYWAPLNGAWVASKGAQGIQPEGDIAAIIDAYTKFVSEPDTAKRTELLKFVVDKITRNLYMIGTVTTPPLPVPVSNKFKNMPKSMVNYATRMEVWEYCQVYLEQ